MFGFTRMGTAHVPHHKNTADAPVHIYTDVKEVLLPLSQHIGAPATPLVKIGDTVTVGQKIAEANGVSTQEAERFFAQEMEKKIRGDNQVDEFYEKVKIMLIQEGEVSDAIGRLTDYTLYETLSYTEKQRYTLELSQRYLRALERFKKECMFLKNNNL
jgi:hypothetical protein